jgi:glycogen(starch) synthase
MIKTRILLASVLKPVNDTRMFHKLGVSLSRLPATAVYICGFAAPQPAAPDNIFFYPLFAFRRLAPGRLLAPWRYLRLLFRVKPHLVVVGTFELLLPSLVYKLCHPCRLVYDIRENYYLNLKSQQVFPPLVRDVLAAAIRAIELLAAPAMSAFFLAEKSYRQELPFLGGKSLVLENKFKPYPGAAAPAPLSLPLRLPAEDIRLLYSGTISELYGVFEAIDLCCRLNACKPVFSLTIIGYCPQPKTLARVRAAIRDKPYICLAGGSHLVPHQQIVAAIQESHLGLLPYHPHPSLFNCRPTKLFEYLAAGLPVLVQHNPNWQPLIDNCAAGILIDYKHYDPAALLQQLAQRTFYAHKDLRAFTWEKEEEKLYHWMKQNDLGT